MIRLVQKTAPNYTGASLPITVADFKTHARVVTTNEDTLIEAFLRAATIVAETRTHRSIGDQQWTMYFDGFPYSQFNNGSVLAAPIQLLRAPVATVDAFKYMDQSGVWTDMILNTDYTFDQDALPPYLMPAYQQTWPITRDYPKTVQVDYTAGYMHSGGAVPEPILMAIRLIATSWYENREAVSDRPLAELPVPIAATTMLDSYKVWRL